MRRVCYFVWIAALSVFLWKVAQEHSQRSSGLLEGLLQPQGRSLVAIGVDIQDLTVADLHGRPVLLLALLLSH